MKKTFKAAFCLLLVLTLALSLAACNDDISGRYILVSVSMNGNTFTAQQLKDHIANQDEMYLELNSDGTGTMAYLGDITDMKWEGNEIWPANNVAKATFTVEGNTLTMEMKAVTLVFQK